MNNIKTSLLFLSLAVVTRAAICVEVNKAKPDRLCQMLFDSYIIPSHGKSTNGKSIIAAQQIIADRSHTNGFWRVVLGEFLKHHSWSERSCLRIFSLMLADEPYGYKPNEDVQSVFVSGGMPYEIVPVLIAGMEKDNNLLLDDYVVALVRSRAPQAKTMFEKVLEDDKPIDVEFHSAIGLAQLGEAKGYEWLIDKSDKSNEWVDHYWPFHVENRTLSACCIAALQYLTNNHKLTAKKDWQAWWPGIDKSKVPKYTIPLTD